MSEQPKRFGGRQFLRQEELDWIGDNKGDHAAEEISHAVSLIARELVYKAVENHGLNDMTITIKKQEMDRISLLAEGWMFELRGEIK